LGMLNPAQERPIVVFAFKDSKSFSYYAPAHSAGFFQRGAVSDYICLLDPSSDVILHEYTHAAIRTVWPSLPVWMEEGLAGYYSTAKWTHDTVSVGGYLWGFDDSLESSSAHLLPSLLDAPETLLGDDVAASARRYMLSWALAHMMITQPVYAPNFREFLEALSSGHSPADALQSTCGRTLAELEGDLGEHLRKGHFATVKYPYKADRDEDGVSEGPSNAQELEIELKLADLLSQNPSGTSRARARLEQLSVQHPESSEVEERLATLSWRAGDEAGVRAHMKKAYQLGSQDADLLVLDAQLELKTGAEHSQVIPMLERALAEKPGNYRARSLLGYFAYESKNYSFALSLLKPIEDVDDPEAFIVLGSLAYSTAGVGDYASASTYASKALTKARSDEDRTTMRRLLSWIAPKMGLSMDPSSDGGGLRRQTLHNRVPLDQFPVEIGAQLRISLLRLEIDIVDAEA
jgi:tetratricopeptide (TPR) repeat protein